MKYNLLPCDGEAYLLLDAFKSGELANLVSDLAWRQDEITLWGKTHPLPRLQAWYADAGLSYTYSKIKLEPLPWSDDLKKVKEKVERLCRHEFNSVLCNLYRDGADKNGWHRDNELELGDRPTIASVSFGATRKFSFRHRQTKERIDIDLPSGSLLLMRGDSQESWEHQLVATKKKVGMRLNLTFRYRKNDDR